MDIKLNDIIEMKRLIKQKLIADPDILEALHNTDIDLDSPDEFLDNKLSENQINTIISNIQKFKNI